MIAKSNLSVPLLPCTHRRSLALVTILPLLVSCSVVRTYPICLYDTTLGAMEQAKEDWPALQTKLTKAVTLVTRDSQSIVIVTSRAAVVRTTDAEDKVLQSIWPPIACYGSSSGSVSGQELRNCERYVKEYMKAPLDNKRLANDVIVPPCQTLSGAVLLRESTRQ